MEIELPASKVRVLISEEDAERVSKHRWFLSNGYAARSVWRPKRSVEYLHRFITNAPAGVEVDHINRNKLDNRRENLRLVSRKVNSYNLTISKANKSGHTGVSWNKLKNKWRAYIFKDYRQVHLGLFDRLEDAVAARAKAKEKYHSGT